MKTRLKIFTTILSVLACFVSLPEIKAAPQVVSAAGRVLPRVHNSGRLHSPFKTLPPALETQELVGVRSFQSVTPASTPVWALERWSSTLLIPIPQLALQR